MKKILSQDFINVYSNVMPPEFCETTIKEFERLLKSGAGWNRQNGEGALRHHKSDRAFALNYNHTTADWFQGARPEDIFFQGLQECFEDYITQYSQLKQMNLQATHMKMQRTDPGEGYHLWHSESMDISNSSRVLAYMLYLNTLDEDAAGETEFLYQQKRIKAVENTMVLWPAGFTHTHRGNTVHGTRSKYIITGWFYLR